MPTCRLLILTLAALMLVRVILHVLYSFVCFIMTNNHSGSLQRIQVGVNNLISTINSSIYLTSGFKGKVVINLISI